MSLHIIIDGYNLIRQSKTLSAFEQEDIQRGREVLVEWLAAYKRLKHHKITVVFDGLDAPSFLVRKDQVRGIDVRFSQNGEQADAVIKRMAARERERALIVSSDMDVVNFSELHGSATISSPQFEEKIEMAVYMDMKGMTSQEEEKGGWTPTTKKKGPAKRLSKKKRRSGMKIKKL